MARVMDGNGEGALRALTGAMVLKNQEQSKIDAGCAG
jgi:hypothetical protein